ncbi:MAG: tRNA pseudouridine(55) synthase TruB [Clostridia bacterium]|nr:tRNA pseudouridine(55) synthase TruB [Clostridia bacterium]
MSENKIKTELSSASGILCINKAPGFTSHDVVNKLRRLYSTKKVGHTGTLDPMATGVLIVLIGRAVKASEYLMSEKKEYTAGLRLGMTTDTEDSQGTVLERCDTLPKKEEVAQVCERFVGDIMQIPPMYSALKVGGRKLVDIARSGGTVEREARPISVYALDCECVSEEKGEYKLNIECSKGTYVRTLCADIGGALGCGGIMYSLERRRNCGFSLSDCHTLEEIEAMEMPEREDLLIPLERAFENYERLELPKFYADLARNGVKLIASKVTKDAVMGKRYAVYEGGSFFALAETVSDADSSLRIKLIKQFS